MKNEYEVRGETTAIFLRRRDGTVLETLIDTANFFIASSIPGTWHAWYDDTTRSFYVRSSRREYGKRHTVHLHGVLIETSASYQINHINRDTLDNRRTNLRVVTRSINQLNRGVSCRNTSGVTGVHWSERQGKWIARVKVNRRFVLDKQYASFEDAVTAREREFARVIDAALVECGAA